VLETPLKVCYIGSKQRFIYKSSKICINCQSKNVISKGIRRGIKRYFCKDCMTSFSSIRRPEQLQKIIFEDYFLHRQTLKQLSAKYANSIPWIMKQRDEYFVMLLFMEKEKIN